MGIKLEDVKKLAELARIDISGEEAEELLKDMSSILNYVGEIKEASGKEVAPEAGELRNIFREDKKPHDPGEYSRDLLDSAPKREDGYVKVKQIL